MKKAMKIVIAITAIAILGWSLSRLDGRIAIVAPVSSAPTNAATSETISTAVSSATAPTVLAETFSPQAERARAFAEPILAAIADRPPVFEDDFSNPNSGWEISTFDEGERAGEAGYLEGEYFIVAAPASSEYLNRHGYVHVPILQMSDFVLTKDVHFISQDSFDWESGFFYFHFRIGQDGHYGVNLTPNGSGGLDKYTAGEERPAILAEFTNAPVDAGSGNQLQVIAHGSQFAVFLNNQLLAFIEDRTLHRGGFVLGIANSGNLPLRMQIDNVKIWDISDLSGSALTPQAEQARAFAEPILQAIANQAPDVEDDFSFDNGNWDLGYGENPARIEQGVLRLTAADATNDEWAGAYHNGMNADDFVFQFDVRATEMEFDSHLSIAWRWLRSDNSSYWFTIFPSLNGAWTLGGAGNDFFEVANGNSDSVRLDDWFNVTLIAKGSRFAIFIDDQPLYYFEDDRRPIGRTVLGMNISTGDAIAEFDNVKYWNLDNVPWMP